MKRLLIVSIFLTVFSSWANGPYTDPLLQWIYSQPVTSRQSESIEVDDYEPIEVSADYQTEATHDSWDNLYLCDYCGLEVIVDPYADMSEDGVYDVNYVR